MPGIIPLWKVLARGLPSMHSAQTCLSAAACTPHWTWHGDNQQRFQSSPCEVAIRSISLLFSTSPSMTKHFCTEYIQNTFGSKPFAQWVDVCVCMCIQSHTHTRARTYVHTCICISAHMHDIRSHTHTDVYIRQTHTHIMHT